MEHVLLIAWLSLGPLVGIALGQGKGRAVDGAVFGFLLGPLGWLLVALLPRHEPPGGRS